MSVAKTATKEAIVKTVCSNWIESMGIADLGCSSGPNTLVAVSEIVEAVCGITRRLDRPCPELKVYLNDLYTNDFNNIFTSLPAFYTKLKQDKGTHFGPCFISAVPGSFYGVLNKGKIYISESSPESVVDAYSSQFQSDFLMFLKCRSQEMVKGGRMVLSLIGRDSMDPTTPVSCYQWELLGRALMILVARGEIEEEKVDSFDAPYYAPCMEEVKLGVEKEGSFMIEALEAYEIDWDGGDDKEMSHESIGERVARTIRAVVESMLESHFVWQKRWYKNKSKAGNIPPGNEGIPFVGETLHFMAAIRSTKGVYEFVRLRRLRYGKWFKTKILGETHVFMSSMESGRAILNNEVGKFSKRYIKSIAELVGPHSLLSASPRHHKFIRGRLFPLFSTTSLSPFVQHFDQLVVQAMSAWPRHDFVVIQHQALMLTCKAMCKMLIGIDSGYQLEMMQKQVACVCEAMLALPLRFTGTRFYKGLQARKRIMDILEKAINERRSGSGCGHEDFLQRLLAENENKFNEEEVERLTDKEIQDNILTMIIAGQDTTANAITWMVKFVEENQGVLDKLMEEQLQFVKKRKTCHILTLEDLNEMPYASKVVKESLRMASVVQWFPRVALEDCEIEGFKIKKGWNVNVDARSIHLDPTVYSEPNDFNPSRFNGESKAYSFLAFGMGGRTCLGKNMAKAMMLVFLHRLITTYKSVKYSYSL
ncbi:abscisic acid 8'-hydroxylase 4 [Senna tora]|uniref:Abscisic acid 8'-hydroxylase 4 n=1 Tax=Senna tora TaxID=362788 RepID=A0A834TWB6_9FABA|nr:abscisic acid 8'-hydroxylase 4 [Senna tora]